MNNYNNPALNQLYDILRLIRAQLANQESQPYFYFDNSYVDLNLKLLTNIGQKNHLATDKLETALNQFSLDTNYKYYLGIFTHLKLDTNESEPTYYPDSQWTLKDLNQIVGMLTPMPDYGEVD